MRSTISTKVRGAAEQLHRDESGWAGDVIAYPAVLLLCLALLQFGLYYVGGAAAQSAVDNAYQQARGYHATSQDGITAGTQTLAANGHLLTGGTVTVERTATTVIATVTGSAISLVPVLPLPTVNASLTGPVERWTPAP